MRNIVDIALYALQILNENGGTIVVHAAVGLRLSSCLARLRPHANV